jgi:hypothetical protein
LLLGTFHLEANSELNAVVPSSDNDAIACLRFLLKLLRYYCSTPFLSSNATESVMEDIERQDVSIRQSTIWESRHKNWLAASNAFIYFFAGEIVRSVKTNQNIQSIVVEFIGTLCR